ncbi:MAG TPA: phage tail tape measure protein, partial [Paralcaligenes sp.]
MANKKLSAVIEIGGAVAGSLKSALGTTKSKMLEIGGAVQQIEKQQKALTRTIEDQARKGKNANAVTVQYAQQELALLDKKVAKLRQVQTQFRTLQAAQDANLSKRANLRGQLFDAVALGATLAAPMRAAVAFESAMADVRKVVDFDTAGEFKQMGDEVLRLSTQLPMAADGIAQIVAAGGQAGIAKNELIQFATSATKMGVAFDITADEAGQMMAEWRAAFKMSQPEVDSLADKINLLGNTTAASAPRISAIVRRVGPLGEVAGVASGEIAALGATMVGVGIQEEVASTGIQNMMLGLVVGTAATKKQQTAYDALGLSAEAVAKRMQVDARGAILSVLEAVKKLPKETQAATLSQLFGKESIKAIAPLLTVTENLVANLDKVADAQAFNGTVNKEYAARAATTANNMQLFQNRVAVLGVTLGNILLPPLNATMATIGPILTTVADLATEFPMVTQAIVMGGAALIGLKVAGIAAGYAWTFLR